MQLARFHRRTPVRNLLHRRNACVNHIKAHKTRNHQLLGTPPLIGTREEDKLEGAVNESQDSENETYYWWCEPESSGGRGDRKEDREDCVICDVEDGDPGVVDDGDKYGPGDDFSDSRSFDGLRRRHGRSFNVYEGDGRGFGTNGTVIFGLLRSFANKSLREGRLDRD